MTSKTSRLFQRSPFFGIGGALVLAIGLTTAIASPAQTFNTLLSFDGSNGSGPVAGLAQGRDGDFYGTAYEGGAHGGGTVYRITADGALITLYSFTGGADGANPGALILATDGNFYGTTNVSVFKITPAGKLTTLTGFGLANPGRLVQAADGDLYGTTSGGGVYGYGAVFKITRAGALTTLYSFTGDYDGACPRGSLVQVADGNLYGATQFRGFNGYGYGTIFKITRTGKLTTLHRFDGTHGMWPTGGLVQASDGNLYGTTQFGGLAEFGSNWGTVFKITLGGTLTTLYNFASVYGGADGLLPSAGLVQGSDGNFYGMTGSGGSYTCSNYYPGCGTVFEITPTGTLTTLHSFDDDDGAYPSGGVLQATNGIFYGTTTSGGAYGDGTIFSLSTGLGPFVTFVRDSGKVGWTPEILGQGFTGTTAVSFNGTPAAGFTVKSDTYLRATVPVGVTTGPLTVTIPSEILTSNVPYRVLPTILSFSPTSGPVGTQVTITGVSLTQTTKVGFGGVPATQFTVNSDTQVTATVPSGAQTGKIALTTLGGKTWSTGVFTVTQ